ncbi:MAG: hypothetical protein LBR10_03280 [Prevotellaceae bacterium]|jgi:predicted transposase/invertase (TIGR01784 family)|nr:hypothetical protein [Prevotellaceae bacterium]
MTKRKKKLSDSYEFQDAVMCARMEGREIGRRKAKEEVIQQCLQENFSIEFIAKITSLPVEQVENIIKIFNKKV